MTGKSNDSMTNMMKDNKLLHFVNNNLGYLSIIPIIIFEYIGHRNSLPAMICIHSSASDTKTPPHTLTHLPLTILITTCATTTLPMNYLVIAFTFN